MKSKEEILKTAQELCPRADAECAIFINGFIKGWEECLKELGYGQDRETDI
jgi:hypothetical protein